MDKKVLWLSWYGLFVICALLGFLPDPKGFWKVVCVVLSIGFFVPGFLLLKWADDRDRTKTIRQILGISIGSLVLTVLLIMLNFASALMTELWGNIFYAALVVVSSPMVCSRYWALSLFGWACIMICAISLLKKRK